MLGRVVPCVSPTTSTTIIMGILLSLMGLAGYGECPRGRSSWRPPCVHGVWEQGTGLRWMVSTAMGHKTAAQGAASSDRALEMKAAVFAFPKCCCVPEGLKLPLPC